jgi:hypothetical protein
MSQTGGGGPAVLWSVLESKKVKTNDGKEIGEVKEFSQNYVRVEKGKMRKESFWLPKYIADAYDGETLWLLLSEQEILERYKFGEKEEEFKVLPSTEQYTKDFENFKNSPTGKNREYSSDLEQNIRLIENYKNIREP